MDTSASATTALQERIGAAHQIMTLLRYLGLWPIYCKLDFEDGVKNRWQRFLARYYRYLIHSLLTITYTTLMWIETIRHWERLDNTLYISITGIVNLALILHFWRVERKAWVFIKELSYSDDYVLRNDEERFMWREKHRIFKRVAFSFIGGGISVLFTSFGSTLFRKDYYLPYEYWLPFDWHNERNYWYAYIYEVIAMSFTCVTIVTMDMMLCYYLFHVALLYKLIGMRLIALQYLRESLAVKELINIIKLHRKVKRLSLQCESLVSFPIFVQIILSAFILCFSAYRLQTMQIRENLGQFLAMVQFSSQLTLQIFWSCYFANKITVNSDALTTHVYSSCWEGFSPSTRKLMIIYMELLQKPVIIKAGNFFLVGLPVFTKTINQSFSLLAVLLNIKK